MFYNLEIKARTSEKQQIEIRKILKEKNAKFIGTDNQKDIYFKNGSGRLKLRKGDIENYLIYYKREDEADLKKSEVVIFNNQGRIGELEKITRETHEVLIEVDKTREIYFIENVKFHIDNVSGLGRFIEIEAISHENLIKNSYSDMLLSKN